MWLANIRDLPNEHRDSSRLLVDFAYPEAMLKCTIVMSFDIQQLNFVGWLFRNVKESRDGVLPVLV